MMSSSGRRPNPFSRDSVSPSPSRPSVGARPRSAVLSPSAPFNTQMHSRHQSLQTIDAAAMPSTYRFRSNSTRNSTPTSMTFAPKFIKSDDVRRNGEDASLMEGENDFSGKRYVWLKDSEKAFVRGSIVLEKENGILLVQCDDGTEREVSRDAVDMVNPAKFDKADDMAELTHLNEPSVVHNLHMRYQADLIYTYSGLFLVTVNPYCPLPIYTNEYIRMYKGRDRENSRPHIFAIADEAFRNLVEEGENQSILVTGESGAGKTENTKKVIQYLAAVATSETPNTKAGSTNLSNLSQQILRANPILEAFGNAQTVRNNNSSRFGKFIRIEFTRSGQIAGALINWYLFEKSRVVKLNRNERNYHVFYQLLRGATEAMRREFFIHGKDFNDFMYTRDGNDSISGVSDRDEWNSLVEAFNIMGFSDAEQKAILKTVAGVLHLGNIQVTKESLRADQACLAHNSEDHARIVCQLLGIPLEPFIKGLLHPRVKAGREWVEKVQTPEQVRLSIDALAKGIYQRSFGDLVSRINRQLDRTGLSSDDGHFIGVLDIAGFEIFEQNSFEQLCINYTNEKLQQFFNHHMFVLEQEEYAKEQIEWKFIDFGKDLQPTIDLIELPNPIGIFSCLDEDSVMPKATDKSFTEKLHSLWDRKTPKYKRPLLNQGFILTHYAAEVEYSTEGWLEKNKDPLNDNITRLLATSSERHVANLFADCGDSDDDTSGSRNRVKKGLFRTVAQRHKEELSTLMRQLHSTHPHFVRCILPNNKKRPKLFSASLVLDQLRCNGVLEGIRIARTGFPNRLPFVEFQQRYEVLCPGVPKGYMEGQQIARIMLEKLNLDQSLYRVGLTKVFFRAGVLAELEEQRDCLIRNIVTTFQSIARGFTQRRIANKRLYRAEATRIIQRNLKVYLNISESPWWGLFVRMRPLLGAARTSAEVKKRDELLHKMEAKMQHEAAEKQKLEEDRRRTDLEIQKIRQTLESERALALDKDEIFKRLQTREVELEEKLADALKDQDQLEEQLDELLIAKKGIEDQLDACRGQLEQAAQLIAKLEGDKEELNQNEKQLQIRLQEAETARSARTDEHDTLSQEIKMLKSHLSLKERKIQDLEAKMLKTDQELDVKLATTTKDLNASKTQIRDLVEENRGIRQQLSELSSTSTDYEDLMRQKEGELAILKADLKKFESDRKMYDSEKQALSIKHDNIQSRLRDAQAQIQVINTQKSQLEKEAAAAKTLLETKLSEDAKAGQNRKLLEEQVQDLKSQLSQVQGDLARERQSRDDVQLLSEHNFSTLQRDYESLNESKIIIEKELYSQQDILRRATEGRASAEKERKQLQSELSKLRKRFAEIDDARLEAESERSAARQANERHDSLRKDLELKDKQLLDLESERVKLAEKVQELTTTISDAEIFKLTHDQHKERLERELVTVKGRLTASENDNRALLNKIQHKNLEIARSNSRAGENQRTRFSQLQAEKNKLSEENGRLSKQLSDAQVSIAALEKQKEKLSLNLEDLNHEIAREHKTSRNAEKASSNYTAQLAEANRNLESERQLRSQAQANTRKLQDALDQANGELTKCHDHLILLQKVFDPNTNGTSQSWEKIKPKITATVDLAQQLEASQQALDVSNERCSRAEKQLEEVRRRHEEEMSEIDERYSSSKRALLEEINQNQVMTGRSPKHARKDSDVLRNHSTTSAPTRRHISNVTIATHDSTRSDKTVDTMAYNRRMDLAAEVEMLQNQLQMSQMQNRHLQGQIDRTTPTRDIWQDDSPSLRRVQKLERENNRLHEMLDDSTKKVSTLEKHLQTGELSLRDVTAKSHEELFDLINSQEGSRKALLKAHNHTVSELADAKEQYDKLKHAKLSLEVELRDLKSEYAELMSVKDQDSTSRSQLLQEFSDLQVRLDTETSKLSDAVSSLNLYKGRSEEYFSRLEQAEIAVIKATRAEQFAKTQAQEVEETCATIMAERKQMDATVEDLQRQNQRYEERIEDMAADLEGALQAKKRLQHELEDYRSQRAMDIEDKESSMEQTRRKYQAELSSITNELDIERENVIYVRNENTRLRDELEDLRSKWDDELLNSSTWAKEKARMEMTVQDLSASRDEAVNAHNEAQSKIVSLLSQVRNLRTSMDEIIVERDMLQKEKRSLEHRLTEAADRLEELTRSESPSMRNAAGMDRDLLDLKSQLARQEDIAAAAVDKMRRAEAVAVETQKDISVERESNVQLHKDKAGLEKQVKDLQLKLVDFETRSYSSASQDVRFLHGRIEELEKQIDEQEKERNKSLRSVRNVDRTVKDLQSQIERRDRTNAQLNDEISKARDKVERFLKTIDELQSSDSNNQLQARRLERELREEKEKALRLERELEGWKALRVERSSLARSGTLLAMSEMGSSESGSRKGSRRVSLMDVPQRQPSNSKGFL